MLATALILMVPLIAMQFTDEVNWGLFDFVIIGTLLLSTGLAYEVLARKMETAKHRAALAIILTATVLLIWAELAVGIFGTPFAGT